MVGALALTLLVGLAFVAPAIVCMQVAPFATEPGFRLIYSLRAEGVTRQPELEACAPIWRSHSNWNRPIKRRFFTPYADFCPLNLPPAPRAPSYT